NVNEYLARRRFLRRGGVLQGPRLDQWARARFDETNGVGARSRGKPPDESLLEALGWLLVRLLHLGQIVGWEAGVKCSCTGFERFFTTSGKWPGSVQPWWSSL